MRAVLGVAALTLQMLQHHHASRHTMTHRGSHPGSNANTTPHTDQPDRVGSAAARERVPRGRRVLGVVVRVLRAAAGIASLATWLLEILRQAGLL